MGMFATILIIFFSVVGLCLLISFMQVFCPITCMMVAKCRKKRDTEAPSTTVIICSSEGRHIHSSISLEDFEKPPTYEEAVRQP